MKKLIELKKEILALQESVATIYLGDATQVYKKLIVSKKEELENAISYEAQRRLNKQDTESNDYRFTIRNLEKLILDLYEKEIKAELESIK